MPDQYRVTIRLSPALYAQLEARGSQGQPLTAIVRDALEAYLARQSTPPLDASETTTTLAAMTTAIEDLQDQVRQLTARLDAVAAMRRPATAIRPSRPRKRPPPATTTPPAVDPARHVLGKLCPRGHDYHGTGQSLLQRSNHKCVVCHREQARERRQAQAAKG